MSQYERAHKRFEFNKQLRTIVLDGLELPDRPEHIDFDQPLFGRGLELDSLDTLEIVSLIEEEYGVFISDDDQIVFGSLNRLADKIEEDR